METLTREAGLGGLHVFLDISPPFAAGANGEAPEYICAAVRSLRIGARCVLMGGLRGDDVGLPYERIMHFDLTVVGKWMYEPEDVRGLVKMAETGALGHQWIDVVGRFSLDQWEQAWMVAEDYGGKAVAVIEPFR